MKKVAIFGKKYQKEDQKYFETLIKRLLKYEIEIVVFEDFSTILDQCSIKVPKLKLFSKASDLDNTFDLLISLGGDGTILGAVTYVRDLELPILGINTGRLGFLATINKKEIKNAIDSLMNNEYYIQERALLQVESNNDKVELGDLNFALNEVTLARKNSTSMIALEAYLNDEYLTTYWADGLIVATPTGSTGYSLSCHGPIIIPESNNFMITPIAPHNLSARPLVIPDKTEIKLKVIGREKQIFLSMDSRVASVPIETEITLKKAAFPIRIVQLNTQTFIKTLRDKLLWGEDKRNYMKIN